MNYRWTFILSLIALTLLGWFHELNSEKKDDSIFANKNDRPTYIGEGMHTTVFNKQGNIKYIANAKKITAFEEQNKTFFEDPQVFVFDKEKHNVQEWEINSQKAILNSHDDILELIDDVRIQSLLPATLLQQVFALQLKMNLTTEDISSNKKVTLVGQNFTTSGLEFIGNLKTQFATLKKQVKTHYDKNEQ